MVGQLLDAKLDFPVGKVHTRKIQPEENHFVGHPNLKRFLLPDDWPEGEYPFRKKTYGSEQENAQREEND